MHGSWIWMHQVTSLKGSVPYIQVHSAASAGRFSRGRIASLSHKYVDDIDFSMVLSPSISILEAMSLQLMCFCYMVIATSVTCFSEKIKIPKELDAKKHCHWNSCILRTKLGTSDVLHVTLKGHQRQLLCMLSCTSWSWFAALVKKDLCKCSSFSRYLSQAYVAPLKTHMQEVLEPINYSSFNRYLSKAYVVPPVFATILRQLISRQRTSVFILVIA